MDLLEDPAIKQKYQKSKYRVKIWESEFIQKIGRKPNKTDIKQADIKIKQAYKVYWNLKTRALDDSLSDITFCDDSLYNNSTTIKDSIENSTFSETSLTESSDLLEKNDSMLNSTNLNDTQNISNESTNDSFGGKSEIENEPENCNVDMKNISGIWSKGLNLKKNEDSEATRLLLKKSNSSFQLSQKMFRSSSFAKRNPRKALSANKLPKLKSASEILDKSKTITENEVNESVNESVNEKDISDEFLEPFLESNIKIKTVENLINKPVANAVQHVIASQKNVRPLDRGWIERCTSDIKNIKTNVNSVTDTKVSDDEDFVYNSDSDDEHRRKRVRKMRKNFSAEDLHQAKRIKLDNSFSKHQSEPLPVSTSNLSNFAGILSHNSVTSENLKAMETETSVPKINVTSTENKAQNPLIMEEISKPEASSEPKISVKNNKNKANGSSKVARKNTRRKAIDVQYEFDYQDEHDIEKDESDEEVKPKRKTNKKTNKPKVTGTRKSLRTGKKAQKAVYESEEEKEDVKNNADPKMDTFDIENVNTIARLPLNPASTGNLIADFSQLLMTDSKEDSNDASQNYACTSSARQKDIDKLERKMASGTINDNFVRINLKKKVYVRGKKNFNFSRYKKGQWKQKKKDLQSSESRLDVLDFIDKKESGANFCFRCNESGHFSKYCPNSQKNELLPLEESEGIEVSSEFPSLAEAALMAKQSTEIKFSKMAPRKTVNDESDEEEWEDWDECENENAQPMKEMCKIPEELIEKLLPQEKNAVPPLYTPNPDYSVIDTPPEVFETLRKFGHESFRPGQEKAIMRILSGVSTLVTLTTGTGKSLCYQLAAYMFAQRYKCITLVVSPLVSLMDDQVKSVCPILKMACLHTNQSEKVREQVIDSVRKGKVNILLISPEAIVSGETSKGFSKLMRDLPPIAFACIDEAHCISQWSHNFRPSYLMLCRVLKEKLKVKVLLGLTATATKSNAMSIVEHLGVPDGLAGVITDKPLPSNLQLTVSRDVDRDQALIELLRSPRLNDCDSILIYCTRREECVRIAGLLRTVLQDHHKSVCKPKNKKISPIAEAYHAGFSASQRNKVQQAFMEGEIRIIVATVAFGMGINKSDIRCVIHYNMPSNFENYVQEIGRAGRDGLPAQCHLFLHSNKEEDKMELRRHIFANAVERPTIRKLLHKLFIPCSCLTKFQKNCGQRCPGHEVALPVNDTVETLDTNEEIISTLLCYLELHSKNYITVLSSAYVKSKVSTFGGSRALKLAALQSPPLAMAVATSLKEGTYSETDSAIEFNVIEIASNIGWDSGIVKSHLKGLEWITVNDVTKRSQLAVNFHTLGLRVRAPGDLSETELDEALNDLFQRCKNQETSRLSQLNSICEIVRKYSVPTVHQCTELSDKIQENSEAFKQEIRKYFVEEKMESVCPQQENMNPEKESQLLQDIRSVVLAYPDTNFTGRAIARIFYGIQSPNYPAYIWYRCRFWRKHRDVDFNYLCQLATQEIFSIR